MRNVPVRAITAALFAWPIMLSAAESVAPALPLDRQLLSEPISALAADARTKGDPHRGAELFHAQQMACLRCHSVGVGSSPLGPDLSQRRDGATDEYLVESVLAPSRSIRRGYETVILQLVDGTAMTVFVVEATADALVIRDVAQAGRRRSLPRSEIEVQQASPLSIMPEGQVNLLRDRQAFLDLVAYLIAIAEGGPQRALALRPAGAPSAPPPTAPDTSGSRPQVYRTMMPEAGPGALAVGLGHDTWLCFDPRRGGIDYAWIGGLDLSPTVAQKINQPANLDGRLFYRDVRTDPWTASSGEPLTFNFRGYRFVGSGVTLRYDLGDVAVSEHLAALDDGRGFTRRFEFSGSPATLWLQIDPQPATMVSIEPATRDGERWRLEARDGAIVTMRVRATPEAR